MRDFNQSLALDNDSRIASGEITVLDFSQLVGAVAEGSIEVLDWELLGAVAASVQLTITDYTLLAGKIVTVNGTAKTAGVDWTAGSSNNATATSLASALAAISGVTAAADGAVVTVTADVAGVAGNAIGISTNAETGLTLGESHLLGGRDSATIVVGEEEFVEGTDFDAETDNATTATNIAAAIDGTTDYASTADGAVVSIESAAVGDAWNVELSATPALGFELSGDELSGGRDEGTINLGATEFVQGTDFDAETSNSVTATNIASAIDDEAGYVATADGAVVTITAAAAGVAGNGALSTNYPDALTLEGVSGGSDFIYSDVFEYYGVDDMSAVNVAVGISDLSGGAVDAVLEVSQDKENWVEVYEIDQMDDDGTQEFRITNTMLFARLKFTITADETADAVIRMVTSLFAGDNDQFQTTLSGSLTIADAGGAVADVPVPLSETSMNFDYIDVQADIDNADDIEIGQITLIPGASQSFTKGNLKNIIVTGGAIGAVVRWQGMKK